MLDFFSKINTPKNQCNLRKKKINSSFHLGKSEH